MTEVCQVTKQGRRRKPSNCDADVVLVEGEREGNRIGEGRVSDKFGKANRKLLTYVTC